MTSPGHRADAVLLFVVSLCVLAFEIGQIRAFSYAMDPLLVYGAIAVAMLGLGVAGVLVSLFPRLAAGDVTTRAAVLAALFGVSALASMAAFARLSTGFSTDTPLDVATRALPILLICAVPYLLGGLATTLLLTRGASRAHALYVANLLGSALGCFLLYPFLRKLGLPVLLVAVTFAASLGATLVLVVRRAARGPVVAAAVAAAVTAGCLPLADAVLPFEPDPRDLYASAERFAASHGYRALPGAPPGHVARREYAVWDPVARVEVFQFPGQLGLVNGQAPVKVLLHDGGAGSLLFGFPGHDEVARALYEGSTYGSAYALVPRPRRMLVIGLGGGPDVLTAQHFGVRDITAIEVNGATLEATRSAFAAFLGHPVDRRNVRTLHLDGRSFVEGTRERFDLIQISGTDTYSAGGAGAFMFSESYLYTLEAIERYVQALTDHGVLAMIRFGPESLRLFTSELVALRRLGVARPDRHLAVIGQGACHAILLSRQPITREQTMRTVRAVFAARALPPVIAPLNEALGFGSDGRPLPLEIVYLPGMARDNDWFRVARASRRGQELAAVADLDLDYSPVTDDRPFFFQFLGPQHWRRILAAPPGDFFARGLLGHFEMLLALAVVSAGAILGPLLLRRRERLRARGLGAPLVYFAGLGLGFLFVEIALMQRTALFLGHPTYSISVTLFALLASSALGSLVAGRLALPPARVVRLAAVGLVTLLLVYGWALQPVVEALLPLPLLARVPLLALLLSPLGLCMGVPFPTALRAMAARGDGVLAWVQAVNGFTSVLASLLAVPLAMFVGFRAVLLVAAGLYAVAALVAGAVTDRPPDDAPA